ADAEALERDGKEASGQESRREPVAVGVWRFSCDGGSRAMSGSVLVLHTGGTIGMVESPDGRAPEAGALAPYLDWIVESSRGELPPIAFLELDPPIDSANGTPDE